MKSHIKAVMVLAASLLAAGGASAQTFNTTGSMNDNGTYGDILTNLAPTTSSSLRMQVTGWQVSQSTNAISSAWVGLYSPGMGVTGLGDYSGDYNNHQIDNANGYNDFVLLQFNAPVVLASLNLNSFLLGSPAGYNSSKDNDLAIAAVNIPEAAWNSQISPTLPAQWTTINGSGADGSVSTGVAVASRQWLVAAAFNSGNNDGFKISSITVAAPVPEPASWAMMIVGFGAVGFAMRGRRARSHGSALRLPAEANAV